jgi:hypothetical protein
VGRVRVGLGEVHGGRKAPMGRRVLCVQGGGRHTHKHPATTTPHLHRALEHLRQPALVEAQPQAELAHRKVADRRVCQQPAAGRAAGAGRAVDAPQAPAAAVAAAEAERARAGRRSQRRRAPQRGRALGARRRRRRGGRVRARRVRRRAGRGGRAGRGRRGRGRGRGRHRRDAAPALQALRQLGGQVVARQDLRQPQVVLAAGLGWGGGLGVGQEVRGRRPGEQQSGAV